MIDHDKAMKKWKAEFGKEQDTKDSKGRLLKKAAYGDRNSQYGWELHHIKPKSKGGTDAFDNLAIVHWQTHDEIHGR